jgi:hypothetical protein
VSEGVDTADCYSARSISITNASLAISGHIALAFIPGYIISFKCMAMFTTCLSRAFTDPSAAILILSDRLKVIYVYALPVPAEMVEYQTLGNRAMFL